jgi:formylglycine-generating enzyme required for sulfatase activity
MKVKETLRIVLSYPGDVKEERKVMEDVIEELNRGIAQDRNLLLELSRWETDAYPGFHAEGPQGLIDPILKIEDCDILLGVFWKRFGTPTKDALSGTEHEIRMAIEGWKKHQRPQIMIYFKEAEFIPKDREEWKQYDLVLKFRDGFPKEGLYWPFKGVPEFEKPARNHLSNLIRSKYPLIDTGATSSRAGTSAQGFIRDYCRRIQNRFSTIYLFGGQHRTVGEGESTLNRMASIEKGFVPLHLTDWREGFDQRDVKPFKIEDLFFDDSKELRFLVRGLPGGGKTTLMHYLGYRFASLGVEEHAEIIPAYSRLRDFFSAKKSLEEFVYEQINADCDSQDMCDMLCDKKRFLERPMVLLLDGLDEIEDPETDQRIAGLLEQFVRGHPRCKVIITSRPIGLRREDYPRYRPLDLLPLSPKMVDNYLERWFTGSNDPIANLQQVFREKPRIYSLATNPFLLSMICYTFEQEGKQELIERRSQLYENCTRYLLQRSYDPKEGRRPGIEFEQALGILKELSLRFFLWQEADFSVDHVNVIGEHHAAATELGKTEEFLDRVQRQSGLIQRTKEGFTFVHRSLWEYFTALALLDRKQDFVIRQAANPDWEEVVRLYAGLLPGDEDVKDLIRGLWTINRPLALRATTEVRRPAAEIIQPLIVEEEGNQGKLLLIDSLEQSLPLVAESERQILVQETLGIMLLKCEERDCEVIFHAQRLLEKMGLKPLQPGGVIYELLDLGNAAARQQKLLNDPLNCFEWIQIQGGTFSMGDDNHGKDERPAHPVKVDSFCMAKHPVTNRLLADFPFGEKYPNYGGESHPAIGNTWWEAYYFALWLDARLPTEAEWEYAARGGKAAKHTQYYFGDNPEGLADHAWFGEPNKPTAHAVDEINPRTGKTNLNPLGLANMLGNVWEWCSDWDEANYYRRSMEENPQGPETGSDRVVRGGSWYYGARGCRSATRYDYRPDDRDSDVGFRLSGSVSLGS